MNFTAIDFETATSHGNSICSMGICVIENNRIVETKEILIRPEPFEFQEYNILIHGITPDLVADKPRFCDYWEQIKPYLENRIVVAHNASFDIGALRTTLDYYKIEYPVLDYLCTVKLSQKAYPELPSHKLNAMADALGISFCHHHAADDAYVCAQILLRILEDFGLDSLEELEEKFEIGIGKIYPGYYEPCRKNKKKATHRKKQKKQVQVI